MVYTLTWARCEEICSCPVVSPWHESLLCSTHLQLLLCSLKPPVTLFSQVFCCDIVGLLPKQPLLCPEAQE